MYLLNRFFVFLNSLNKTLKNTGKVGGICQSENVGTMINKFMDEYGACCMFWTTGIITFNINLVTVAV